MTEGGFLASDEAQPFRGLLAHNARGERVSRGVGELHLALLREWCRLWWGSEAGFARLQDGRRDAGLPITSGHDGQA
jgi:hypothetical protein